MAQFGTKTAKVDLQVFDGDPIPLTLRAPVSLGQRWLVAGLMNQHATHAGWAALSLCLPDNVVKGFGANHVGECHWDVAAAGLSLADALLAKGVRVGSLTQAGTRALALCLDGLSPVQEDVKAAEELAGNASPGPSSPGQEETAAPAPSSP
jgi:hypothetical protein